MIREIFDPFIDLCHPKIESLSVTDNYLAPEPSLMANTHPHLPDWLAAYNPAEIMIGVIASHSSLQILHGAREEGFRTLGICVGKSRQKMYKAFPGAEPDEWMVLDHYHDLLDRADELRAKNVIIIPHGSLVEYLGPDNFIALRVPTFGTCILDNHRTIDFFRVLDDLRHRTPTGF